MLLERTTAAVVITLSLVNATSAQEFNGTAFAQQYWFNKGLPLQVAEGIASEVNRESGGDPTATGDGGTSLGQFQHHNDRMMAILARIENDQAWQEWLGDDPIAAAHFHELMAARTPRQAGEIWKRYFERPAGTVVTPQTRGPAPHGAPHTPPHSDAGTAASEPPWSMAPIYHDEGDEDRPPPDQTAEDDTPK